MPCMRAVRFSHQSHFWRTDSCRGCGQIFASAEFLVDKFVPCAYGQIFASAAFLDTVVTSCHVNDATTLASSCRCALHPSPCLCCCSRCHTMTLALVNDVLVGRISREAELRWRSCKSRTFLYVSPRFGLALFLCIAEQRSTFWFHSSSGRRRVKSHFFKCSFLIPTQNFSKFSEVELLSR